MSTLSINSVMTRTPSYHSLNQASPMEELAVERNNVKNAVKGFFRNLFSCLPSRQQSSHIDLSLHENGRSIDDRESLIASTEIYNLYCDMVVGLPSSQNMFYLAPGFMY